MLIDRSCEQLPQVRSLSVSFAARTGSIPKTASWLFPPVEKLLSATPRKPPYSFCELVHARTIALRLLHAHALAMHMRKPAR